MEGRNSNAHVNRADDLKRKVARFSPARLWNFKLPRVIFLEIIRMRWVSWTGSVGTSPARGRKGITMRGVSRITAVLSLGSLVLTGCSGDAPPGDSNADLVLPTVSTRPKGTVEERLVKAETLVKEGKRAEAIETLGEALMINAKERKVLFLLAKLGREESLAIQGTDPGGAYRAMVTAGGYLRELGAHHPDATDEEKTLRLEVLLDEASAHARSKRIEETTGTLREAVGAGFRDFARLKSDKDWQAILEIPQFKTAFDEIAASAK
jgi:hypothetical protein